MILTDKAKKQFNIFVIKEGLGNLHFRNIYDVIGLKAIPFSMQWGVYLEFADSLGYDLSIFKDGCTNKWNVYFDNDYVNNKSITRKEAQLEALNQLNIVLNI